MIRILLADDHAITRDGLRTLLSSESGFEIVGEASNGLDTLRQLEKLKPDVLIVDVQMPEMSGLEVVRQGSSRSPDTKTIVLSMYDSEGFVVDALRHGASGYVLKEADIREVIAAIRDVTRGKTYLSERLSQRAIDGYIEKSDAGIGDRYEALTSREREMVQLVAEGKTRNEIADRLSISPRTVEVHRGNMMRKLGLHNIAEVVKYALKRGLIS